MSTLYVTHEAFLAHDTGPRHPEQADRLRSIETHLARAAFQNLHRVEAPAATVKQIERVHPPGYIETLESRQPASGRIAIDADTVMSAGTLESAYRAAGAGVYAVDEVMAGRASNAFCAVRPPGHHAEPDRPMGFCFFSNIAIAARHAQAVHGVDRVAVIDFDVHHGNGTQAAFWPHPSLLYASSHQTPLFPGSGHESERGVSNNIVNVPLHAGDGATRFRAAYESIILPAVRRHRPGLILVSAGFDAHRADPLANIDLVEDDFAWVTRQILNLARDCSNGRVVSMLEGGYNLDALGRSVAAHVQTLMEG